MNKKKKGKIISPENDVYLFHRRLADFELNFLCTIFFGNFSFAAVFRRKIIKKNGFCLFSQVLKESLNVYERFTKIFFRHDSVKLCSFLVQQALIVLWSAFHLNFLLFFVDSEASFFHQTNFFFSFSFHVYLWFIFSFFLFIALIKAFNKQYFTLLPFDFSTINSKSKLNRKTLSWSIYLLLRLEVKKENAFSSSERARSF